MTQQRRPYNPDTDKAWADQVHQTAKQFIEELLTTLAGDAGMSFPDIAAAFKRRYPFLANDAVLNPGSQSRPYWQWRVSLALAHLKRGERIRKVDGLWIWAPATAPPLQRPPVVPPPPPKQHSELIEEMEEIGKATGRVVLGNYNAPYRYDVPLARSYYVPPDIVVEICDRGSVDKDFASLNWARQNWDAKSLLITVDHGDFKKAQTVVGGTPNIFIMKAETLRQLHSLVEAGDAPILKALFQ
jgi:hypothetical protein